MAVEHDVVFTDATWDIVLCREIDSLEDVVRDLGALLQATGEFYDGLFSHAIDEQVGTRVAENAFLELILPVVVMGESAQGCLDAAKYDGHVGEELLEDLGIDDGGIFRSHVVPSVGTIGILRAQSAVGCVFVHHRVHAAWGNTEEESGAPEFLEVSEVTMPVGLWHDSHAIASCFEGSPDDGGSKRGVVDIGIAREQDDIHFIPSPEFQLLLRRRQKIRQSIFHYSLN